ncbi:MULTISPECIES: Na(+)/H(+) antiporter subunit C [Gordonia]|uniref:Na(+)/H(+) antiporter subunit C n=1 Tax=Gordonia cholesterolivorans TaxID=559625 RepID=A0ABN3HRP3_9ACTN|nr:MULTISPECIES: Na(+)/H(+) antiporter subunit C [Gordonia]KXT58281.1 cation:proton antiporter [Gordonia sp. QH-12]WFN92468.1 Na(+)/H(+) antiporter subunit C [Gordonia sihwensis]
MSVNLGLLIVAGAMAAAGVYLLTERSLIRMLFGLLLAGNALNLMILVLAGPPGHPPIRGRESDGASFDTDPLAQGMILTAIVITLGIAAFVLAVTYRLFKINQAAEEEKLPPGAEAATDDELGDDEEDIKILTGTPESQPDRDLSDDPATGADTVAGDLFDKYGNPLTPEEFIAAHLNVHEPDLMPEDAEVLEYLPYDGDEMPRDADEPNDDEHAKGAR